MDRECKRGVLALGGVGAVLLFFDVGVRVLASNDEARFAVLARDVLRHGTWLLPRLGDTPYLNKPPLVAWLIALVSWPAGGVTQSTAIWPSLAAALGIVLVTWWIGRRLWDQAVGLTAGFVVLTMHGVFTQARTAMPDIVLCLAMTGAMAVFVGSDFGARPRVMLLCHLFLALGFLAKGPAALLGLVVIAVHGLVAREGPWWRRLAPLQGAGIIVLVVAPWWLIAMSSRGSGFVHDTVVTDWLQWFEPFARLNPRALLTPFEQTLAIVLPWSPLLLIAVVAAVRARDRMPAGAAAFLLAWLGVVFTVVALSSQQRMRYYLPLCPAAALLVAVWYHHLLTRRHAVVGWAAAAAVAIGLVTWQVRDDARHNAATDLRTIGVASAQGDLPLYTLGVPNLVAAFYFDRPVLALDAEPMTQARLAPGYFIVEEHALARWPAGCAVDRLGDGAANGRRFSVLRLAPPGCRPPTGGVPSAG
ncbi:MAG TPA: glycosyltransferase family 39 protein [Methylomirabilota bacterium]